MARVKKLYSKFPTEIYVTREEGDGPDGYFCIWESKKDAAENAAENDSELAIYTLETKGTATVDVVVRLNGEKL